MMQTSQLGYASLRVSLGFTELADSSSNALGTVRCQLRSVTAITAALSSLGSIGAAPSLFPSLRFLLDILRRCVVVLSFARSPVLC